MTTERRAFLLGTSMKRVRQIRRSGLTDPLAVRDWIQAITGVDPGPIPEKFRIGKKRGVAAFVAIRSLLTTKISTTLVKCFVRLTVLGRVAVGRSCDNDTR